MIKTNIFNKGYIVASTYHLIFFCKLGSAFLFITLKENYSDITVS